MARTRSSESDVIVVGSGATGGWAAKELTEKGLRVMLFEAGPQWNPQKDYPEPQWPYELKYRNTIPQTTLLQACQPVQSKCQACNEYAHKFFVAEVDSPYTTPEDKPFDWIRGRQVGGCPLMWGRQSCRLSDYEFKAASRDGFGEDWPISYRDLEPYYNQFNQSWEVKNLFVTDGACFVSQGCQNPTLTMMALTVRACDWWCRPTGARFEAIRHPPGQ
jgi:choline dehydrogenase-like flavoprotein